MDIDYLTKFELREMMQHPDYDDPEGMLYLAAKLRELPENNRARFYFDKYYRLFHEGLSHGIAPEDIRDENISIAREHPRLTTELRALIAAVGWYGYYNEQGE